MNEYTGRVIQDPREGVLACQLDLGFGVWSMTMVKLARIEVTDEAVAQKVMEDLLGDSGGDVVVRTIGQTFFGLNSCDVFTGDGIDIVWMNEALVEAGAARWVAPNTPPVDVS